MPYSKWLTLPFKSWCVLAETVQWVLMGLAALIAVLVMMAAIAACYFLCYKEYNILAFNSRKAFHTDLPCVIHCLPLQPGSKDHQAHHYDCPGKPPLPIPLWHRLAQRKELTNNRDTKLTEHQGTVWNTCLNWDYGAVSGHHSHACMQMTETVIKDLDSNTIRLLCGVLIMTFILTWYMEVSPIEKTWCSQQGHNK